MSESEARTTIIHRAYCCYNCTSTFTGASDCQICPRCCGAFIELLPPPSPPSTPTLPPTLARLITARRHTVQYLSHISLSRIRTFGESSDVDTTEGILEISSDNPLPPDLVAKITSRTLTQEELNNNLMCCICREDFLMGEEILMLPCGHLYHNDCILSWFEKRSTCPICRMNLNPTAVHHFDEDHETSFSFRPRGRNAFIASLSTLVNIDDNEPSSSNNNRPSTSSNLHQLYRILRDSQVRPSTPMEIEDNDEPSSSNSNENGSSTSNVNRPSRPGNSNGNGASTTVDMLPFRPINSQDMEPSTSNMDALSNSNDNQPSNSGYSNENDPFTSNESNKCGPSPLNESFDSGPSTLYDSSDDGPCGGDH